MLKEVSMMELKRKNNSGQSVWNNCKKRTKLLRATESSTCRIWPLFSKVTPTDLQGPIIEWHLRNVSNTAGINDHYKLFWNFPYLSHLHCLMYSSTSWKGCLPRGPEITSEKWLERSIQIWHIAFPIKSKTNLGQIHVTSKLRHEIQGH